MEASRNDSNNPKTLDLFGNNSSAQSSSSTNKNKKKKKHHSMPKPQFISHTATTKFSFLKHNLQTGSLVSLDKNSKLFNIFYYAKWDSVIISSHKWEEFYCNMAMGLGINGKNFLTSVVCGKPILIDHIVLARALRINPKMIDLHLIDVNKEWKFNKPDFHKFLTTLCNGKVDDITFIIDTFVSSDHFIPVYQHFASIVRANIFPNHHQDKVFNFVEMRLMHKLINHKIDFNSPYQILLKMIGASKAGYMPYGLLLTTVFDYLGFNVNQYPNYPVTTTISEKSKRIQTPLADFNHVSNVIIGLPNNITSNDILSTKVDEVNHSYLVLKREVKEIGERHKQVVAKVDFLTTMLNGAIHRANIIEQSVAQLLQLQLGAAGNQVLPDEAAAAGEEEPAAGDAGMMTDDLNIPLVFEWNDGKCCEEATLLLLVAGCGSPCPLRTLKL